MLESPAQHSIAPFMLYPATGLYMWSTAPPSVCVHTSAGAAIHCKTNYVEFTVENWFPEFYRKNYSSNIYGFNLNLQLQFFSTAYTQNLYLSHNFWKLTLKQQKHTLYTNSLTLTLCTFFKTQHTKSKGKYLDFLFQSQTIRMTHWFITNFSHVLHWTPSNHALEQAYKHTSTQLHMLDVFLFFHTV